MSVLLVSILVLVLLSVVGGAVMVALMKKRIERGTRAKAAARAAQGVKLAEGRLTAEAEYVLAQIDDELERSRRGDAQGQPRSARLEELREVLSLTFGPQASAFPVSGPCAEVIEALRDDAGGRDVLYSESGDGRWLHVRGDRALFRWAFRELCRNTLQHGGDWTRLSILAEPVDGAIVLTVRDDGRGLDLSLLARLYSPFTPRTGSPGPGLGLYVVRRVVETMGGTIEARTSPGQGLLHRLRLPSPAGGPYGDESAYGERKARSREESRL